MVATDKSKTYPCTECDQNTYGWRTLAPVMWVERNGRQFFTPDGLEGWGCSCGEFEFGKEQLSAIKAHVDVQIALFESARLRGFVERIEASTGMKRAAIAEACGIHYTYLSKIINGRKAAGAPLAKLMQLFSEHPHLLHDEQLTAAVG